MNLGIKKYLNYYKKSLIKYEQKNNQKFVQKYKSFFNK